MFSVLCDTNGYRIVSTPFSIFTKKKKCPAGFYIYIFFFLSSPLYTYKNKFPTQVDTPRISPFGPVSVSPAP